MAHKSLFHVERFDSLHRHQVSDRYIKQQHSDEPLRQFRLDSTESDPAKATGGQHASVLATHTLSTSPLWNCCKASSYSTSDNYNGEGIRMMRQENEWHSVMTERPGAERKWTPEMGTIIVAAMVLCVVTIACIGISNWLSKKIERGASSGADADRQPL